MFEYDDEATSVVCASRNERSVSRYDPPRAGACYESWRGGVHVLPNEEWELGQRIFRRETCCEWSYLPCCNEVDWLLVRTRNCGCCDSCGGSYLARVGFGEYREMHEGHIGAGIEDWEIRIRKPTDYAENVTAGDMIRVLEQEIADLAAAAEKYHTMANAAAELLKTVREDRHKQWEENRRGSAPGGCLKKFVLCKSS